MTRQRSFRVEPEKKMITLGLQDIRFLLARSRGEWLPEEQGGAGTAGADRPARCAGRWKQHA